MNIKQFAKLLNKFFNEGKIISLKSRKQKNLLKTVIKKGAPKTLRAHAYMLFFGGFHHLKGQRYEHLIDFQSLLAKKSLSEENESIALTLNQINKDLMRTHFPQEDQIRKFENLWGIQLKINGFYSLSKLKEETDLLQDENKGKITKKILKYMKEVEELQEMARNVLFVYSLVDEETGYVQGMNSIASSIVYNVWMAKKEFKKFKSKSKKIENKLVSVFGAEEDKAPKKVYNPFKDIDFTLEFNEKECFYIFYGLMKYSNQRRYFNLGLDYLQKTIAEFELYLSHELPEVHKKMCYDHDVNFFLTPLDPFNGILCFLLHDNLPAYHSDKIIWKSD